MVIKVWQWEDGTIENREAWIKKELSEVDNYEKSMQNLIKELENKDLPELKNKELKVYKEIVKTIQKVKNERLEKEI